MKHVVHYRNLKMYLALGMKLTKIHRVIEFNQKPWMKTYIDFNTDNWGYNYDKKYSTSTICVFNDFL